MPAIAAAIARNIPVVVDPKYKNSSLTTARRSQAQSPRARVSARRRRGHFPPGGAAGVDQRLGVDHLLLTLGEAGMALIAADAGWTSTDDRARGCTMLLARATQSRLIWRRCWAAGATPAEAAGDSKFRRGREVAKLGAATVSIDEVVEAYDLFGAAGTAESTNIVALISR